jgi:hypothetical protein
MDDRHGAIWAYNGHHIGWNAMLERQGFHAPDGKKELVPSKLQGSG